MKKKHAPDQQYMTLMSFCFLKRATIFIESMQKYDKDKCLCQLLSEHCI